MNNKFTNSLVVLAVGGLMFVGSAIAQSTNNTTSGAGPGVVDPGHPRVNEVNAREANQQKRIGNGVANGTLTSKQATHLEKRETAVQNREKADMAAHNGHLTKAEQAGINRQQNRISRSIKRDKESNK
jgi:CRISPR/Cas system-associated endoribonuclease Cas2